MATQQVDDFLSGLELGRERFLYGLEQVPDDRLEWTPGGSAKSPLAIAGKLAGFLGFLTHGLGTGAFPDRSGGMPPAPDTREAARQALEERFTGLRDVVANFTEEDLRKTLAAPWGKVMTKSQWLGSVASIVGYFQGQLNYAQLVYGDENPNIPPSWMPGKPAE